MREVFARIGFGHWRIQRTFASWPTPGPSVGGLTGGPGELFVVEAKVSGGTHLLRCALSALPSLGPLVGVQTARGCAEQPSLNGNRRQYACGAFWSFSPPALRECRHRGLARRREAVRRPAVITVPHGGKRLLQPRCAVNDEELWSAKATLDQVIEAARQASVLSPPMLLAASNTFWSSVRTPMTTSSEIDVAFRSSRTRTTVPSRINRTIGSSASERAFQASQSLRTFRHTRLTTSLPSPSANSALSARRTRRVLVPARYAEAIKASAASVRR